MLVNIDGLLMTCDKCSTACAQEWKVLDKHMMNWKSNMKVIANAGGAEVWTDCAVFCVASSYQETVEVDFF